MRNLVLVLGALVVLATVAVGWTTSNLTILYRDEDSFYNYDFESQNVSSSNVDWPVTMLHYNGANVDIVQDGIYWGSCGDPLPFCAEMWGRMNDGGGFIWFGNKGTKTGGSCTSSTHMRSYAGNQTLKASYNVSWGYYVVGTTHVDKQECFGGPHGWSETAEETAVQRARQMGYTVFEDYASFYNAEPYREECVGGNCHVWDNNGLASAVYVP